MKYARPLDITPYVLGSINSILPEVTVVAERYVRHIMTFDRSVIEVFLFNLVIVFGFESRVFFLAIIKRFVVMRLRANVVVGSRSELIFVVCLDTFRTPFPFM